MISKTIGFGGIPYFQTHPYFIIFPHLGTLSWSTSYAQHCHSIGAAIGPAAAAGRADHFGGGGCCSPHQGSCSAVDIETMLGRCPLCRGFGANCWEIPRAACEASSSRRGLARVECSVWFSRGHVLIIYDRRPSTLDRQPETRLGVCSRACRLGVSAISCWTRTGGACLWYQERAKVNRLHFINAWIK